MMARSGRTLYDDGIIGAGLAGALANQAVLLASTNDLP
jgi:hypothetical protein